MLVCITSAISLHKSAFSMHQVCIFINLRLFTDKPRVDMQNLSRTRADYADLVQTLRILGAQFIFKLRISRTMQTF